MSFMCRNFAISEMAHASLHHSGSWRCIWSRVHWERGQVGIWEFVRRRRCRRRLEIWKFGDMGTWKSENWESQKVHKYKLSKSKPVSSKNVGKVWISRKKSSWPFVLPFHAFSPWARQIEKNVKRHAYVCYSTSLGPLLLSTLGGAICITSPGHHQGWIAVRVAHWPFKG